MELAGKSPQGNSAVGQCRDTWWLGAEGILCGSALRGYSLVGHCMISKTPAADVPIWIVTLICPKLSTELSGDRCGERCAIKEFLIT